MSQHRAPSDDYHGKHRLEDRSFEVGGTISDRIRDDAALAELARNEQARGDSGNDPYTNP